MRLNKRGIDKLTSIISWQPVVRESDLAVSLVWKILKWKTLDDARDSRSLGYSWMTEYK